jgi:hypothetical protein
MSFGVIAAVGGGVAVGGAVAGGIMSSQAAGRASAAAQQAAEAYQRKVKKASDQFEKETGELKKEVRKIDPNINLPKFTLQGATLEGINAANRVTQNTIDQLKKIDPNQEGAVQMA